MSQSMQVAAVQMRASVDVQTNLDQIAAHVGHAANAGAQVVCLQELVASRYFCQSEDHQCFALAETIPGPTSDLLGKLAAERQVVIIAGIFERRAPGLYHNSAITIDADGSIVGLYRKMHIPDDPGFFEKFYFTPGDLGFCVAQTRYGKMGVCICWDQWFPEAARLTALQGAEILVYPTAIGWLAQDKQDCGSQQMDAWITMMRSHAIANGLFVVAPNRVGVEDQIEFWGNSFVCDPYGEVVARAGATEDATITADVDLSLIETARTHWPFLRDRRIDAYDALTRRFVDTPPTG